MGMTRHVSKQFTGVDGMRTARTTSTACRHRHVTNAHARERQALQCCHRHQACRHCSNLLDQSTAWAGDTLRQPRTAQPTLHMLKVPTCERSPLTKTEQVAGTGKPHRLEASSRSGSRLRSRCRIDVAALGWRPKRRRGGCLGRGRALVSRPGPIRGQRLRAVSGRRLGCPARLLPVRPRLGSSRCPAERHRQDGNASMFDPGSCRSDVLCLDTRIGLSALRRSCTASAVAGTVVAEHGPFQQ